MSNEIICQSCGGEGIVLMGDIVNVCPDCNGEGTTPAPPSDEEEDVVT